MGLRYRNIESTTVLAVVECPSDHFAKVANRTNGRLLRRMAFSREVWSIAVIFHRIGMTAVSLVHPDVTHRIPVDLLVTKCRRFIANQELTREPCRVQSAVAADAFQVFVATVEGNAVDITEGNYAELSPLCEEFGFDGLTVQLSMFQPSIGLRDAEVRRRISVLEERWQQSERQTGDLPSQLSRQIETQERAMAALEAEVA
jgi:hypothetical protein